MKNNGWFLRLLTLRSAALRIDRVAGALAAAIMIAALAPAVAQDTNPAAPAPAPEITVPEGYTLSHSIDVGGRIANPIGSGAMYDTLVNLQSGPRVMGESFELHAIPGARNITLLDNLSAFSTGFGGDPYTFTKLDMNKGKAYEFSGTFRRDRQFMDYNLLGNPNIQSGFGTPIGASTSPTGSLPLSQFSDSPFLFNTVRRMIDTDLTVRPVSRFTYRFAYSRNVMQGPTLTPSGNAIAGQEIILQEFERNDSDDFTGAIDWKPVKSTKLTFEEQIDHYKADSYFTLAPQFFNVQEPDGTPAQTLLSYTSFMPYGYSSTGAFSAATNCNAASMGNSSTILKTSAKGGMPVIDPACGVFTSYLRSQPTRVIFPTEMFLLQSKIKNVSMNGTARYTNANMNMPNYYEQFNGLTVETSSTKSGVTTYTAPQSQNSFSGSATAKREVIAADYGIVWQLASKVSLEDKVNYSNIHQPGSSNLTGASVLVNAATTGLTINSSGLSSCVWSATGTETCSPALPSTASTAYTVSSPVGEGYAGFGAPQAGYLGQRFATNNLTVSWDATPRSVFSLTWRYQNYLFTEGQGTAAHNVLLTANDTTAGEIPIHQNGGIVNAALHPTNNWDISGSFEAAYNDSVITPMDFRQLRHYRVHTLYRAAPWATISGAFNDLERHNNTNNMQDVPGNTTAYFGPLDHVDHTRIVSLGTQLYPNDRYGLDLNYTYNDVYMADNICFQGAAAYTVGGKVVPGAATQSATMCGPASGTHGLAVLYLARDFQDAPTQFGSAALALSPNPKLRYNLGYRVSAVNGTHLFEDARDVNGSNLSTYQTPFVSAAWKLRAGLTWKGEYDYYGYGEGGPSGAQYCNANAALASGATSAPSVLCNSVPYTAIDGPAYGATTARNFHANNVTLGFHYEF